MHCSCAYSGFVSLRHEKLDRLLMKSFIPPFIVTFMIAMGFQPPHSRKLTDYALE